MLFDDHNGLRVTEIFVKPITLQQRPLFRGYAMIVLNNAIRIDRIGIVELKNGRLIAAFPSRRLSCGDYLDYVFPIDNKARIWIENVILAQYAREIARIPTDAEHRQALDDGLIEPPPSSCGHPTEQILDERKAGEAA